MGISYNNWFCCDVSGDNDIELCRIRTQKKDGFICHVVITYYEGKILFSGSMAECKQWIDKHWLERRYFEHGKD